MHRQATATAYPPANKLRCKRASTRASRAPVRRADASSASSEGSLQSFSSPAAQPAQTRAWEIVEKLAAVHFRHEEEATALHRADADAQCGSDEGQRLGQSPPADDLRALRTQLESVLFKVGLNVPLDLD
ncbi:hypothetical protein EDB86DRAFT_3103471 [Lactarius hatsudake]|nr:hypothetical protein EDB86DRAFT_3103471 [Lactarius hatsudake]